MNILITGGTGQLGRSLQRALAGHQVMALSHADLDVAGARPMRDRIVSLQPSVIIHAAALTDTNRCEREPDLAKRVNGISCEHMGLAADAARARLYMISTNEVFDGSKQSPYLEDDRPKPLNAYGLSKTQGEAWGAGVNHRMRIVRTSWLYGDGYVNFNEKVLATAREGRPLSFVTDEIATPTSTDDLAAAIAALIERDVPPGIYHLANSGEASRYDWAREVLRLAGMADMPIAAVTTAELRANGYAGPQKPPYSVLANTRAAALGVTLRPWQDALAAYFARSRAAADA